jgi:membrane-associated protein
VPEHLSYVIDLLADYGYPLLALLVLLENAGLPVPGETALLAASVLCSPAGGERLELGAVIATAACAAFVGDNLGFWLVGRWARRRLDRGRGLGPLTPERMRWVEGYFARFGMLTVFAARLVPGLRVICGPAAGAAGLPWGRFALANACGAAVWAGTIASVAYLGGQAWARLHHGLGLAAWALLVVVVVAFVVWQLGGWRGHRSARAGSGRPAGSAQRPDSPASEL